MLKWSVCASVYRYCKPCIKHTSVILVNKQYKGFFFFHYKPWYLIGSSSIKTTSTWPAIQPSGGVLRFLVTVAVNKMIFWKCVYITLSSYIDTKYSFLCFRMFQMSIHEVIYSNCLNALGNKAWLTSFNRFQLMNVT